MSWAEIRRVVGVSSLLTLAVLAAGCRSIGSRTARTPTALNGVQVLFRIEFAQGDDSGSGRLTLRSWTGSDFALELRDTFGRGLWELRLSGDSGWIADLQNDRYCGIEADRSLLKTVWAGLSPRRLPRVLLGLDPLTRPSRESEGTMPGDRLAETSEGQWHLTWSDGVLDRWSLWREGRPVLWWQRESAGGVLSGVSGAQLRWRVKVAEPIDDRVLRPVRPANFSEVRCDQLALP